MTPSREPGLDRSDLPPRERPGRAPWMVFGSLVVLVFIGFGTFNLISLLAHEEHDEHATFDAAGITLVHVDNSMGPVRIERADADVIDIAVHVSDGLQHTGVSWHVEQSTLEVRGTCPIMESPWCRSAFTLLVPARHRRGRRLGLWTRRGVAIVTAPSTSTPTTAGWSWRT